MASAPAHSPEAGGTPLSSKHQELLGVLNQDINRVISKISEEGFSIWIVGGAVRDSVIGFPLNDIDLATNATPSEVLKLIPSAIPTGMEFGTVTLPSTLDSGKIEITTLRTDGTYLDGRRPESVRFGSSLMEDLQRRDFTVNSMAIDPIHRLFYDPHGGIDDLQKGVLSAVGNPIERLEEDGLRIMRAYRFMCHPSGPFVPDLELSEALVECAESLAPVSRERIWVEFRKLLSFPKVFEVLNMMVVHGNMENVCPGLNEIDDIDSCYFDGINENSLMIGRFSLLLKQMNEEDAKTILNGLRVPNKVRESVLIIRGRIGIMPNPESKGCLRRYRMALGDDLDAQISADRGLNKEVADNLRTALNNLPQLRGGIEPLVGGDEILTRLDIEPGPLLGEIKKWLFRIQVENDLADSSSVWNTAESLGFKGEPIGEYRMWV